MSDETKSVLIVLGTVAYVICPLDFDFIPVFGWLDDIVVIGLCIAYFVGKAPNQRPAGFRAGHSTDENDVEMDFRAEQRNQTEPPAAKDEAYFRKVLNLSPNSTILEIKRRYKELVSQYHPDKVIHLGPKLQELASAELKAINEAYEFLWSKYASEES